MNAGHLAAAIVVSLAACQKEPPTPARELPQRPVPVGVPCFGSDRVECEVVDGHVAGAASDGHVTRALIHLLVSRQYACFVDSDDTSIDPAIRALLLVACGADAPGMDPERRDIALNTDIDKLFPPAELKTAIRAGCGVLVHADGKETRGERIYWR